jgi:hypothetical protein
MSAMEIRIVLKGALFSSWLMTMDLISRRLNVLQKCTQEPPREKIDAPT